MTIGIDLRDLEVPEHRPGFFDELRKELAPRRSRRPLLLLAAAAAIVASVLAFTLTRGSEVADAAQVQAAVEHALASTGSISGRIVSGAAGTESSDGYFVLSSTGAFKIVASNGNITQTTVYDPARSTEVYDFDSVYSRTIGLAPGQPDIVPNALLQSGMGSILATLAHVPGGKVENVTYDGRSAWLVPPRSGTPGDQTAITVDRATGIPVRWQTFNGGALVYEWRIEHLRASSTVARITLPAPTHGQKVGVADAGFRHTSLARARTAAGYQPLVPTRLPHGFTLAGISFASSPPRDPATYGNGNPASRDVISLSYRRGLDEIVVTTRRTGADPSAWFDPFWSSPNLADSPSRTTFTGGALAGESGNLVLDSAFPHIWIAGPKLVVTIGGTVGRADLLEVANSLHVAG